MAVRNTSMPYDNASSGDMSARTVGVYIRRLWLLTL